jgi:SAM-dependent methyltransferase
MNSKINYVCPCNIKSGLIESEYGLICEQTDCLHSSKDECFSIIDGKPVLISEQKCDTVCSSNNVNSYVGRRHHKATLLKKILLGESAKTKANCNIFLEEVLKLTRAPKVLVIGSGERGSGTERLWEQSNIEIHGADIYASDFVDVVCDAHYLPFESDSYDGVWIQAVLEHVVEPKVVVDEIYRILKPCGVVYAETPFMQQVHEGAYDFTRFTVLGHRYLFKKFEAIEFGGDKGPETVFVWSFRYLIWAITRSRKLARILSLSLGLLVRPLGYFVSSASLHDASSGVFFLGRKKLGHNLTHKELISLYRGQFN